MKHFTKKQINEMDKIYRLNLINSCTGYKSSNLIATVSDKGVNNIAIFSSITHLGSDPAMLGFILRPKTVPRDTYVNIKYKKKFSVNHIHYSQIKDAHHSSAKYPSEISEFEKTELIEEYKYDKALPFVKNAPVQIECKYLNEYEIKENGTLLIVASIENIFVNKNMLLKDGMIQLDKGGVTAINGLDCYTLPKKLERFPYARPKK